MYLNVLRICHLLTLFLSVQIAQFRFRSHSFGSDRTVSVQIAQFRFRAHSFGSDRTVCIICSLIPRHIIPSSHPYPCQLSIQWDFVHFLSCGILSCGILSCGILSVGILSCVILSGYKTAWLMQKWNTCLHSMCILIRLNCTNSSIPLMDAPLSFSW